MTDKNPDHHNADTTLGQIGPYQLIKLIGEGAAGQVFLAEQQQPHRHVAVKVLRTAAAAGRARFEREVELLANLEHNNIARLYDAGTAEGPAGEVPYLVMEYVDGQDLLSYADQQKLDMEQRLKLLAQVARAAHFAHTRGVIHRDLKPGNILVNARGEPKILDFGVAHVVADDATQMTGAGEILGTLTYMSWEQLCGEANRIDARSDVYALGVIGYQLIAGELPFPGLKQDTLVSALGRIQREQATPLSRHQSAARGDIETLIMRAMAREPERRYGSAAELAADIERYLRRQPIEARPPTLGYVAGLFIRRHKALSAATALGLASLLGAVAVSLTFAVSESRARAEAEAVSEFLQSMLRSADPEEALGRDLRLIEVLDSAHRTLTLESPQSEAIDLRLRATLGATYLGLGELERALALLDSAIERGTQSSSYPRADLLELQLKRAETLIEKGEYAKSEAALMEMSLRPGSQDRTPALRQANLLGRAAFELRRTDEGLAKLEAAFKQAEQSLGNDSELTLSFAHDFAAALVDAGKVEEGLAIHRQVLQGRTQLFGGNHPQTLITRNSLAGALFYADRVDEALAELRAVLIAREQILGADHPLTLTSQQNVAAALIRSGDAKGGLVMAREALPGVSKVFGEDHRRTLTLMNIIAYAEEDTGNLSAAEDIYREILAISDTRNTRDQNEYQSIHSNLANLLMQSGREQEALAEFELVHERAVRTLGNDNVLTAIYDGHYGECLLRLAQPKKALPLLENSLRIVEQHFGTDHSRTVLARERVARAREAL